ncbi:addiction module protein [Longimicrobium terrae]|uniref:Putative addiction module component (TIGR02574 family) n=1 Tax=Longimicrobium terrae TaxID=1639882 RepID=A0A841H0R8_9BACT|nr:addiction module protein [Longimicrobium terrae]MBB4637147.1 putative addiction module component (TIGR02574 family) [Longimicrobium terrae]MBB6071592.1 putative addiction module component (TIGR02574 family) [Longimicrobium terrae]NNC29989.1 addiction module protein [Longimicrobium terrae]
MSERKKMVTAEEIEEAALELPREELGGLIERLIASTEDTLEEDLHWRAEIMRRSAEVQAGTARTVSPEEVFAKMRARHHANPHSS